MEIRIFLPVKTVLRKKSLALLDTKSVLIMNFLTASPFLLKQINMSPVVHSANRVTAKRISVEQKASVAFID